MRVRRATLGLLCLAILVPLGVAEGASAGFVSTVSSAGGSLSSPTLAAPSGLAAVRGACVLLTSNSVNLSWTATSSTFADGYEIYRSTTSGSGYASIGTVSGRNTTSFTDTSPAFLTTYYYVVRAKKLTWLSPNSNQAQVTTPTHLCI